MSVIPVACPPCLPFFLNSTTQVYVLGGSFGDVLEGLHGDVLPVLLTEQGERGRQHACLAGKASH